MYVCMYNAILRKMIYRKLNEIKNRPVHEVFLKLFDCEFRRDSMGVMYLFKYFSSENEKVSVTSRIFLN